MDKISGEQPNSAKILQTAMGFFASKTLLTAVKLELFTILRNKMLSASEIKEELKLDGRGVYDFLDALVSMGFLNRTGIKEKAVYGNTADTGFFLDKNQPTYLGGMMVMANNRLYGFWDKLEDALKTGKPQNELISTDKSLFDELYEDKDRTAEFVNAMAGIQIGNFKLFSQKFDFSNYKTFCDVGGAGGFLSMQVALQNPHMECISFDLPQVSGIAQENITKKGLNSSVKAKAGSFFKDDFPKVDVIAMGNILHDWGLEEKQMLIKKAYDALPSGGAFVVIENIIDDERKKNTFGLLMSLNMLVETQNGFDFTGKDFSEWVNQAGFRKSYLIPLEGATSAAIAIK